MRCSPSPVARCSVGSGTASPMPPSGALLVLGVIIVAEEDTDTNIVNRTEVDVTVRTGRVEVAWRTLTAIGLGPVAAAAAWWWAGRAVKPIARIRTVAEEIEAGDLDRRIGLEDGPTEIRGLAASFDAMLDRLGAAASTQSQLIEEASHELRTPLAVLRTNADVVLGHPEPTSEVYRDGIRRSRDAATRLETIIDELLVDARGRARTIDRQPVDLSEIAGRVIEAASAPASTIGVSVEFVTLGPLPGRLDGESIERAIANVVDNAVRHSPDGAVVTVELHASQDVAMVRVIDHGPGIAPENQARVFERFFRADLDRPGVGLGLAIAMHIVEAHGGSLTLTSPGPAGDGCVFDLTVTR